MIHSHLRKQCIHNKRGFKNAVVHSNLLMSKNNHESALYIIINFHLFFENSGATEPKLSSKQCGFSNETSIH